MLEGAYAFVGLTNKKLIGARDPLGIRPLVLGELDGCPILASETCALDIIGAQYVRDVENGEVVVFDEDGAHSHKPFPPMPPRPCIFEYIYFSRPDSIVGGRSVYDVRKTMGTELAREAPAAADVVVPVPDSGVPAAIGYAQAVRHPLRARHHPQPLCRPHLHRADPAHPPARRAPQAQRQPRGGRRQAHRADRRFDRARHHLGQDRADDARCRRHAKCISASPRRRSPIPTITASTRPSATSCSPPPTTSKACGSSSAPIRSPSFRSRASTAPWARRARPGAAAIHRPLLHRRISDRAHRPDRARSRSATQLSLLAEAG